MRRAGWIVLMACLVGPGRLRAGQEPLASPPPTSETSPAVSAPVDATAIPPSSPVDAPTPASPDPRAETEITIDKANRVAVGLGFEQPLGAAASVEILHGLAADVRESDGRVKAVCAVPIPHCARGFLFEVAAGSGGGVLSLGVGARARVDEEDFHGTVGLGLRAALARTWGDPIGTEPGLTYLGPELDLSVLRVDLTLGVLWRVSGQTGASALFSWGVGFGL
jgi:hypothetical protein